MKHHTKFTAILLALLLTVGLLTGCSASAAETIPSTDLVVVALSRRGAGALSGGSRLCGYRVLLHPDCRRWHSLPGRSSELG